MSDLDSAIMALYFPAGKFESGRLMMIQVKSLSWTEASFHGSAIGSTHNPGSFEQRELWPIALAILINMTSTLFLVPYDTGDAVERIVSCRQGRRTFRLWLHPQIAGDMIPSTLTRAARLTVSHRLPGSMIATGEASSWVGLRQQTGTAKH